MEILEIGGNNLFLSRVLGLSGLAISFLGTIGMLWGGLESFIKVKPPTKGPSSDAEIVVYSEGWDADVKHRLVLPSDIF